MAEEIDLDDISDDEFSKTYTPKTRNKRDEKLELVRTKVTKIIKNNFEPEKVPLSILRATFYLIEVQKLHDAHITGGEYTLPPFHKTFLSCHKKKQNEILIQIVKAICYVPKEVEGQYLDWLNQERTIRLPNVLFPKRGLQLGSFGFNKVAKFCPSATICLSAEVCHLISSTVTPAAISVKSALCIGISVTGAYCLCKVGYNVYRVIEHGRSTKFAIKDVLEDIGSFTLANAATLALYAGLVSSLGVGWTLGLAVVVGLGVYWTSFYALEWVCRKTLNVSKDEYLDKAYRHLGLTQKATLEKICKSYRKLSRDNHEDKIRGKSKGEIEEHKRVFLKTQFAMAMIRAAIEKNKVDYKMARQNFKRVDTEEYDVDFVAAVCSLTAKKLKTIGNFGRRFFTRRRKKKEKHPIVLEITSGKLPYEMFLEEDEFEEFLIKMNKQNNVGDLEKSIDTTETENLEIMLSS